AERAKGSQHTFLEVAAGVRRDDRAGKSDDSVRDIAAVELRRCRRGGVRDVAGEQFDFGGERIEHGAVVDRVVSSEGLVAVAVSPDHRACAVVCADLCMADVCIGMVAACRVAVGGAAAAGRWIPGKDCVRHVASWRDAAGPRRREHGGDTTARHDADESDDAPDAGKFFCRAGIVDRMADYGGFFGGRDSNSAKSRTDLGRFWSVWNDDSSFDTSYQRRYGSDPERCGGDGVSEGLPVAR